MRLNLLATTLGAQFFPYQGDNGTFDFTPDALERFASVIASQEREECAKVCDAQASEPECPERAQYCAAAIRARSKND